MASKRKCKLTGEYIRKEDGFISANNIFFKDKESAIKWAIESDEAKRKSARIKKESEKENRRELKQLKEKLKSKSDYAKEAQTAFNAFIRERDKSQPCISCGTVNPNIQYAAGHYKTVGAHPELRFDELNVHKQCNRHCNMALSGNLLEYRKGLIERCGVDVVEYLESQHEAKHYAIDDLKEIKTLYRHKLKDLKEQGG